MDEKLQQLADRLGIATAYTDVGLKPAVIRSAKTRYDFCRGAGL